MNADEVLLLYRIDDPVYQGLIRWRMAMLEHWRRQFLPGGPLRILEIGTGNFPFSTAFGGRDSGSSFVGIERDPHQADRARLHLQGMFASHRIIQGLWDSATADSLAGEPFDIVTSFEVYEHVPAEAGFIANAARVLRPGGLLIIETPNAHVTPLFVKVFGQAPDGAGDYEGNAHVNEVGFRQLFQDFRQSGFEVLDFDNYYLPATLWKDAALDRNRWPDLYEHVHAAAAMFPFYSYVQAIVGRLPPAPR